MDGDDDEIVMLSPYEIVLPGVDAALALILRTRAERCLEEAEINGDYVENHPALVMAICMDQAYESTCQQRLS